MDYPKFIVSNQKEEPIDIQRVKLQKLGILEKLNFHRYIRLLLLLLKHVFIISGSYKLCKLSTVFSWRPLDSLSRGGWSHQSKFIHENNFGVNLYQICLSSLDPSKTWRPWGGVTFSFTFIGETIRNLLVRKYWPDMKIIWHKWSFSDPLPRLLKLY